MIRRAGTRIARFCLTIATIVVITLLLDRFVISNVTVEGTCMEPALYDGDRVWINRFSHLVSEPERFDIVVFRYRYRENEFYMKRVVGLPGETIQIVDDFVFVDGIRLKDSYGLELIEKPRRAKNQIVLGNDEYFVLGDNRNHSNDSRDSDVGNVTKEEITGKVILW